MSYRKYPVQKELETFIECYFSWESDGPIKLDIESPPNACEAIVYNYGSPYRISNQKYDDLEVPSCFINGQSIQNYTLHFDGNIGIIGVALRPGALYKLFEIPMFSLTDERLDFKEVSPDFCSKRLAPILNAKNLEARLDSLIAITEDLFTTANKDDSIIQEAASKIFSDKGKTNVTEHLCDIPMSRRNFERKFLEEVGVSPKMYAKIRRFSFCCSLMAGDREADLMDVLHQGGYYDQSHFIKDFKYFSGRTPRKYAKTNNELAYHVDRMAIVEKRLHLNS
ncbi:MAG: AraC family transcriptional regulator [Flavobacteriaceae bacterium]|nr:helix-turn-helix domain-containing protein [Bacteroidia bacterium]NNL62095.1 AraC family transcriptional regulator [Flavobacteriaceae bacterium]